MYLEIYFGRPLQAKINYANGPESYGNENGSKYAVIDYYMYNVHTQCPRDNGNGILYGSAASNGISLCYGNKEGNSPTFMRKNIWKVGLACI